MTRQAYTKNWTKKDRKKNPEKYRTWTNRAKRKRMGFTDELFAQRVLEQDGKCAICRSDFGKGFKVACADHEHAANIPRGILCKHCNLILGQAKDSPDVLTRAAEYLIKWKRTA